MPVIKYQELTWTGKEVTSVTDRQPNSLKETPLAAVHKELGARMIPFAGWNMPVQYTSIVAEHQAVRSGVGLFDLSHMGELWISGPDALANVQRLLTNDASVLQPGMAQYTFLTNHRGGIIDDLIIYCVAPERYLLVVNAANTEKDRSWIAENLEGAAELDDRSADTALLAIQGPRSQSVLQRVTDADLSGLKSFRAVQTRVAGVDAFVARTGYTGEDGFEVLVAADDAVDLWRSLLDAGKDDGIVPVGLGARDTLRLEASLPLYGNDLSEETTPYQAGLGFFVKLEKGDFIGRAALAEEKEKGPRRRLVNFVMEEKGIPRQGYPITNESGREIGQVTSGTHAPTLGREVGMGYVETEYAVPDGSIWISIRSSNRRARIVKGRLLQLRDQK